MEKNMTEIVSKKDKDPFTYKQNCGWDSTEDKARTKRNNSNPRNAGNLSDLITYNGSYARES